MALEAAVGSFTAPTSAATNTVVSGLGFQPKYVMLLATVATADGFAVTNGASYGMASGTATTAQWAIGTNGDDNVATTNVSREIYDGVLAIPNSAATAALWAARLLSFDAGGFTIDWITVQATGIVVQYLALGGAELSAECGRFAAATALGNQLVGTGIQGEVLMLGSVGQTALGRGVHGGLTFGAATGSAARWGVATSTVAGQTMAASVDGQRSFRNEKVAVGLTAGGVYDNHADFVSFESTPRFTINWTDAPVGAQIMGYCVMRGVQFYAGSSAKPTGAAPQNQDVSVGFTPKAAIACHVEDVAGTTVTAGSGQLGLGVSSATVEGSIWTYHNDTINSDANVRTLSTRILTKNTAPSTSAAEANADFAAVGNTVRLVWNPNDANAHAIGLLAFGDPAVAPTSPAFRRALLGVGV